jgi:hypothetical protein
MVPMRTIFAAKAHTHALNQFLGTSRYEFACHVDVASFRLALSFPSPRTTDLDSTHHDAMMLCSAQPQQVAPFPSPTLSDPCYFANSYSITYYCFIFTPDLAFRELIVRVVVGKSKKSCGKRGGSDPDHCLASSGSERVRLRIRFPRSTSPSFLAEATVRSLLHSQGVWMPWRAHGEGLGCVLKDRKAVWYCIRLAVVKVCADGKTRLFASLRLERGFFDSGCGCACMYNISEERGGARPSPFCFLSLDTEQCYSIES